MGQRGLAIRVARGRCSRQPHSRHTAQPPCAPAGQAYPPHTQAQGGDKVFIRGGGLLAPAVEAGPVRLLPTATPRPAGRPRLRLTAVA
eukprot:4563278-Prymnesium_polylepis.1